MSNQEGVRKRKLGLKRDGRVKVSLVKVGCCCDRGNKKENQDAFFEIRNFMNNPKNLLLCVLDGHGEYGKSMAELARDTLPDLLKEEIEKSPGDPALQFKQAFCRAHRQLVETGDADFAGTTCTMCWISENVAYFANVGDSTLALGVISDSGKMTGEFCSIDHRPELEEERARIEARGGRVAQAKRYGRAGNSAKSVGPLRVYQKDCDMPGLMVSRSLGDQAAHDCGCTEEPYFREHVWAKGDAIIILASDGLWDKVTPQEAVEMAAEWSDPENAAHALVRHALDKGSNDNTTAVVAFLCPSSSTCSIS